MSLQNRRSSLMNIDNWLDRCSNDEPDSMIYEPEYCIEIANLKTQQKQPELEALYKSVADKCTKIGLPPELVEERLNDIDDCISTFYNTIENDVNEEYDKLCQYKHDLLNQIQKILSDLYLPAHVADENITLLQHCKRLKTKFNELNIVKQKRMTRLQELRDKQTRHCLVLGIKVPQIKMQTDIPTEEELVKLANTVLELEKEEKRRKDKYVILKDMIMKCIEQTETNPEPGILTDQPDYTEGHLLKMSNLHAKLEAQYASNKDNFEKLKARLVSLYDRLDVNQEEREQFLEAHSVCKPSLMVEMKIEIERYEELKRQNIGKFIDKIKEELIVEYEACYISQDQQDNFFSLSTISGECNEELLELYERELDRIKRYYNENKEMLEKFQKWRMMWKELINFEVKANDPNRFNNRGGQLLLEERKRKALQKNLPKVEKELIALNEKYSASNFGNKFRIFDSNLDEFIAGCWDELNLAKEQEKRERQRAKMTETKGRKPTQVPKRTPSKRAAGPGITPTPSKLKCQRSVLGTPSNSTYRSNQLGMSGSIKKSTASWKHSTDKSNIPVADHGQANKNGSEISALSLSEQEFEDMIVTCPASAKRMR